MGEMITLLLLILSAQIEEAIQCRTRQLFRKNLFPLLQSLQLWQKIGLKKGLNDKRVHCLTGLVRSDYKLLHTNAEACYYSVRTSRPRTIEAFCALAIPLSLHIKSLLGKFAVCSIFRRQTLVLLYIFCNANLENL